VKYLGYELDHHTTFFVWLLVVVQFAWHLARREEMPPMKHMLIYMLAKSHAMDAWQ